MKRTAPDMQVLNIPFPVIKIYPCYKCCHQSYWRKKIKTPNSGQESLMDVMCCCWYVLHMALIISEPVVRIIVVPV